MAFSWIDDKRRTYVKDERMYPELEHVTVQDKNKIDDSFNTEDKQSEMIFEHNNNNEPGQLIATAGFASNEVQPTPTLENRA